LLNIQIPWLLKLSENLPAISILKEEITDLGAGVWKIDLFIENKGYLPYPIAMGQRNNQPAPVVVILEGEVEFLEGNKRKPLGYIGGNQVKKLSWLVKAGKAETVSAKIESAVFSPDVKQFKIGG
jgi:hypothetical protein